MIILLIGKDEGFVFKRQCVAQAVLDLEPDPVRPPQLACLP